MSPMRSTLNPGLNRQLLLQFLESTLQEVQQQLNWPAEAHPEGCCIRVYVFALESDNDPDGRQREGDGDLDVVGKGTVGLVVGNEERDVHAEDTLINR